MLGLFFVAKKNGMLRMIVGARPINVRCFRPPSVSLATSEAFSRIELPLPEGFLPNAPDALQYFEDLEVYSSVGDVENCFHRYLVDDDFSEFFCIGDASAEERAVAQAEGVGAVASAGISARGRRPDFAAQQFAMISFGRDA